MHVVSSSVTPSWGRGWHGRAAFCLPALFVASLGLPVDSARAERGFVPGRQPSSEEGHFWWRGRVDGVDEIAIRDESVRIHHISAKPIQEQDHRFGSPLPRSEVEVQLNVIRGRGRVRLVAEPSASNDFTAVVRIDDGDKGGDAEYEFELTWSSRRSSRRRSWGAGSARGEEESFQWRGRVDGVDEIVIQGRSVRVNHISAKPIQEQDHRFSAPLPRSEIEIRLNVIEGRGGVRLIQEPSRSNDYSAVVRIDDGDEGGDDDYEFELVWSPSRYDWTRPTSEDKGAFFRWKGRVDLGAVITIRGDTHRVESTGGAGTREMSARFTEPLPRSDEPVSLRKLDGRGKVELVEIPSTGNDYTAVVRIEDDKSGADTYEFELAWKR